MFKSARDGSAAVRTSTIARFAWIAVFTLSMLVPAAAPAQSVEWAQRLVSGPSPRRVHAMAYDSARHVTVLFGGDGGMGDNNGETWEWNGVAWTQRAVIGPSPRLGHAVAYDAARGVTVLFGGAENISQYNGETWEWNGSVWTQRMVTGPSPRTNHSMIYDAARAVTVLFGGSTGFSDSSETWEWNGTVWNRRMVSGPSPRDAFAMAYDSVRNVTVLFGGFRPSNPPLNGETWEWDGIAWTRRMVSGPSPRAGHAMAYDTARGATVLFGGTSTGSSDGANGQTWEWNGIVWSQLAGTGPSPRLGHALAYDVARGVTVLFGGWLPDENVSGETWVLGSPCTADFNGDSFVTSQDFFDFLAAFFAFQPDGDFNHDGIINSQDFFEFLAAFFSGC